MDPLLSLHPPRSSSLLYFILCLPPPPLCHFVLPHFRSSLFSLDPLYTIIKYSTPPACFFFLLLATIDEELATQDGQQRRLQLMDLVRPYVVTAVRYPAFHAPDNHFDFPLSPDLSREFPYSLITPHGFYPLYRQPDLLVERHTHYNMQLDIAPPPVTIAAKLLYFSRSEAMDTPFPPQLPVDRAAAMVIHQQQWPNERPYPSPTQADWREFNAHKGAKLVNQGSWDWRTEMRPEDGLLEDDGVWRKGLKAASAKWDNDWQRFTCCWDPWVLPPLKGVVYTYGSMHGLWAGRMLVSRLVYFIQPPFVM